MVTPPFILTNEQRRFLGLEQVQPSWELVELFGNYYYFDGDIIRKKIRSTDKEYYECELEYETADNRSMVLPKTKRGKPKKLNMTATQSFNGYGVYFYYSNGSIVIANYTTQTTYFGDSVSFSSPITNSLNSWLNEWIADSTETDLEEIEQFRVSNRKHCKFKEGDFFAFKLSRREWGVGRILFDIDQYRKSEAFKKQHNYGLNNLMGRPLYIKIYLAINDKPEFDLQQLKCSEAMLTEPVMDNNYYYGENPIIGHLPLEPEELEFPISYGASIDWQNRDVCYFQYGTIYFEVNKQQIKRDSKRYPALLKDYTRHAVGFDFTYPTIESCRVGRFSPSDRHKARRYDSCSDLRLNENREDKRQIFEYFGLDADKGYAENLDIVKRRG